ISSTRPPTTTRRNTNAASPGTTPTSASPGAFPSRRWCRRRTLTASACARPRRTTEAGRRRPLDLPGRSPDRLLRIQGGNGFRRAGQQAPERRGNPPAQQAGPMPSQVAQMAAAGALRVMQDADRFVDAHPPPREAEATADIRVLHVHVELL